MLQEEGHPTMNRVSGDDMVVIEHEGKILSTAVHEVICQHSKHDLWRRRLRGPEQGEQSCSQLCIKGLQGGNQVGEKAGGVVVFRFERQPGDRCAALGESLGKQGGFAKPGRGGDECERPFCSLLETFGQVSAGDQLCARARHMELGGQQGREWVTLLGKHSMPCGIYLLVSAC